MLLLTSNVCALAENIVFPDEVVVNVKQAPYNARGDGVADDTTALQAALTDACGRKVVYFPNGTYRLRDTLHFHCLGPMIFGQSRDGVILKLEDGAAGFGDPQHPKPVILTMTLTNGISADQFFRKLKHFTVDTGKNPGAIGIRMYSNNEGILQHVKVLGNGVGRIGVELGWMDQNGPMLVRDCVVEGFDTGIQTGAWINSQTLSSVVIRGCRTYGLNVGMQVLSCEGLDIRMVPGTNSAIYAHHGCMLTVIDSRLQGDSGRAAIHNEGGNLFLRGITVKGFGSSVSTSNTTVLLRDRQIREYATGETRKLFADSRNHSLGLRLRQTPELPWESDTNNWLSVAAFGARFGDNQDDTAAFQQAIDAAASQNKTVVYIPTSTGHDPNWYNLNGTVTVHGSVRTIQGLNFSRVIGKGKFLVSQDIRHPVEFTGIYGFGGEPPEFENASRQTMIVRNSEGRIVVSGPANVFVEDVAGTVHIRNAKAHVWARQLNPESRTLNVLNDGGTLWILGLKTENYGVKIDTMGGGKTELLGAHVYTGFGGGDKTALFRLSDSDASFANVRAITFSNDGFTNMVNEIRGSENRSLPRGRGWASWTLYSGAK